LIDSLSLYLSVSGKSSTFAIGILQNLDLTVHDCQAVVLVPIRELVHQVARFITDLGDFMSVSAHAYLGGTTDDDIQILQDGVHVLVGTPEHVANLIQQGILRLDHVNMFILDGADEMFTRFVTLSFSIILS
jgi:translation initiation factor 4A